MKLVSHMAQKKLHINHLDYIGNKSLFLLIIQDLYIESNRFQHRPIGPAR